MSSCIEGRFREIYNPPPLVLNFLFLQLHLNYKTEHEFLRSERIRGKVEEI